jgi:hypothetical protein
MVLDQKKLEPERHFKGDRDSYPQSCVQEVSPSSQRAPLMRTLHRFCSVDGSGKSRTNLLSAAFSLVGEKIHRIAQTDPHRGWLVDNSP